MALPPVLLRLSTCGKPLDQVLHDRTVKAVFELQSDAAFLFPDNPSGPPFHPLGLDDDITTHALLARSEPKRAAILGQVGDHSGRAKAGSTPDVHRHRHLSPYTTAIFISVHAVTSSLDSCYGSLSRFDDQAGLPSRAVTISHQFCSA